MRPGTSRRRPRSDGWQRRAAALGRLAPDASPTLSASEIGAYAFCPQAWYLQRCHLPVTDQAEARRELGSRAHRAIGRRTDLLRVARLAQRVLLLTIAALLALLAARVLDVLP